MSALNGKLISGMTLRLIGIVALSVVAVEPAAAEHCKGQHKNDPGCDGSGTTLGDLSCTIDQIARFDGTNWVCSTDTDTVGALNCSSGQVAKFNGSNWACGFDVDTDTDTDTLGDLSCSTGQVAKFNGINWACGADDDPFVVKDSLGQTVGMLVSHNPIRADVILRFDGVVTQLVVRKNQLLGSAPVFFDQVLCEGNAYFDPPAQDLVSPITGFEKGNIYASSLPPSIFNTTVLSISNNDECNSSLNITNDFIEAQVIGQPNFTPPFHVE